MLAYVYIYLYFTEIHNFMNKNDLQCSRDTFFHNNFFGTEVLIQFFEKVFTYTYIRNYIQENECCLPGRLCRAQVKGGNSEVYDSVCRPLSSGMSPMRARSSG